MNRGLKSVVFAAFAALAVGCGGTEMPADSDNSELGTQESAILGSCNGVECTGSSNACCDAGDGKGYRCTQLNYQCGPGGTCFANHKCDTVTGGDYCVYYTVVDCMPMQ